MRILINDHAGHPFQVQLSRSLARRGHIVLHTYCSLLSTPRGDLQVGNDDPHNFDIQGISTGKEFLRYSLTSRYFQEKELGLGIVEKIYSFRPNIVISANTPLVTQASIINKCNEINAKFVFWVQDLLGVGIRNNVRKKLFFLGDAIGIYFQRLEYKLLRRSDEVVIITDDFLPIMKKAGVPDKKIHVVENWAPFEDMPVGKKVNWWSLENGLDSKFCFLYSGTLGMKHNPDLLMELALAYKDNDNVRIVVLSEGIGAEYLKDKIKSLELSNIILFPFQPFDSLPDVLATGDILIAILEPDAGVFAVPSKVLTYLCTQRPLLLAVPSENLVARIVRDNNAGLTVSPKNISEFIESAKKLQQDNEFRRTLGLSGRLYAERTFNIAKITDQFEKIIS